MLDWVTARGRMLGRFYTDSRTRLVQAQIAAESNQTWSPAQQYAFLERYYTNMEVYDGASRAARDASEATPAVKGLRTPAFQVVEFYVSTVWPGRLDDALQIEAIGAAEHNANLEPAIKQVWAWSNWEQKRQVHVRTTAMLGDGFVKIALSPAKDRVYFELLRAATVTEIEADERGYLTLCRIDVPVRVRQGADWRQRTHTEVWSKATGTFRRWEHDHGLRPVEEIGAPLEEIALRDMHGDDFVPIVHTKFRDVGDDRGAGAYMYQIDKIDEQNRKATRLGQQLFRHNSNTWVITSTVLDKEGRPLPALRPGKDGTAPNAVQVRVGDETMFSLPGGYGMQSAVPQIDYAAALAAEQADGIELQRDLVEKAYWQIMETGGNLSGRALRTLLLPAIARAEEARGTFEQALVRQNQMALTIARYNRLEGFRDVGDFKRGELDHRFTDRPVIPVGEDEEAAADVQKATAGKLRVELGVSKRRVQEELGYSQQEIEEMADEAEADQDALDDAMGALLDRQPGATVPVVQQQQPQPNGGGRNV